MSSWTQLTPRKRVELALRGVYSGLVPFTIYENLIPRCTTERILRNRGLCIVHRRTNVFKARQPNVQVWTEQVRESGRLMERTYYKTPVGTVTTLREPAGFTSWLHEAMFKRPEDYKVLLFMINDLVYTENYAAFIKAEQEFGEDAIFRANLNLEPLQQLISGTMMKMETFCVEWMERRDEIITLYNAIVEKQRQVYRLVAESPALHANYGGNVVSEVIGPAVFRDYYLPNYNEAAEVLHKHGKLIGCHFDANCRIIAPLIAETDLDYIEAFTPAPDTDMTLAEARAAWPDKVLWLNFPSSVHLRPDSEVEQTTVDLLDQLDNLNGVIMGVTEDMPPDRWQHSCLAIQNGLYRHAEKYAGHGDAGAGA